MARGDADRNLLFGILALQMDFISRDALIAAMNAWVLQKHRPLENVLQERGGLAPGDCALLEPLVRRHIEQHGGDAARSLAALSPLDGLRGDLASAADADTDVRASLAAIAPEYPRTQRGMASGDWPATVAPSPQSSMDSVGLPSASGLRFRILRPHARGGLGEVYVARDEELHREVALKQIQERHADHPDSRSRFLLEAEITGGLEHPGIVPVYGLGHYPDGRPFYAMRFIKGDSLKEAIARFHRTDQRPGRDPGERALALRQLLGRFVDVCNAVAYAHNRGVLHRDLKPDNVMLGPYGETLVVDWGLAKSIGRPESGTSAAEMTLRPSSVSGASPTQVGAAVGTPAFMSPEQAAGRLDELGPASDVYSLGAMLYELLAGAVPFRDTELGEVLRKVRSGEFAPPRQVNRNVPPALEAVCLNAMAREPGSRYASPRALADEIEHWLADEPVTAWREPAAMKARRWMRRHRTFVTTAAAALVIGLVGLGIGYTHVSAINRKLDEANRVATTANQELQAANEKLTAANERVTRSKAESDRRLDQTLQVVEDYYSGAAGEVLQKQNVSEGLRKQLLSKPQQFYRQMARELQATPAPDEHARYLLAKGRFGLARISQMLGENGTARQEYESAIALYRGLAADYPDKPDYRLGLAHCCNNLGNVLSSTGQDRPAIEVLREAEGILMKLASERPQDLAYPRQLSMIYSNIGIDLYHLGDFRGSAELMRKGIELATRLVSEHPEDPLFAAQLAHDLSNISDVLRDSKAYQEAVESTRKAIDVYAKLFARHPSEREYQTGLATAHVGLGLVLAEMGDLPGAAAAHRHAIEIEARLVATYPNVPDFEHRLATGYNNLGLVLQTMKDLPGAAAAYSKGIEIRSKLTWEHPDVTAYWRGLANKSTNLALVLSEMGQTQAAVAAYRKALEGWSKLAADHPEVPDYQEGLARTYRNLQGVQAASDPSGAMDSVRTAVAIMSKLSAAWPQTPSYRRDLADGYLGLADAQQAARATGAAGTSYRRALETYSALADAYPSDTQILYRLVVCYGQLAQNQRSANDPVGAESSLRRAVEIGSKLVASFPDRLDFRAQLNRSKGLLASLLQVQGRFAEAERLLREAIADQRVVCKRQPQSVPSRQMLAAGLVLLARVRVSLHRPEDAVQLTRESKTLYEKNGGGLYDVASNFALCAGQYQDPVRRRALADEAVATLRAAIAAGWKNARLTSRNPALRLLFGCDDFRRLLDGLWDQDFPAEPFAAEN